MQRAEAQFRRDLTLPFAIWNLVFRTIVNIGHSLYTISSVVTSDEQNGRTSTDGKMFRDAAITVLKALADKYVSPAGLTLPVDGDLQKARNSAAVKHNPVRCNICVCQYIYCYVSYRLQ